MRFWNFLAIILMAAYSAARRSSLPFPERSLTPARQLLTRGSLGRDRRGRRTNSSKGEVPSRQLGAIERARLPA
jgi:hypothetical protein